MFRRATNWLKEHAVIIVLCACTALSGTGWIVNTRWPAPNYGYLSEQALLFWIGLGALWLYRDSPKWAVTLYFSCALLPVGAMVEHFAPGFTPFIPAPFVGVFVVSALTQCPYATAFYTVAASLAGGIVGLLYADVGGAVAGVIVTALTGVALARGCAERNGRARIAGGIQDEVEQAARRVENALTQTGQLERGLDNLLKEFANGQEAPGPP